MKAKDNPDGFSGRVRVEKGKYLEYLISPRCVVCSAKHNGKNIRIEIDERLVRDSRAKVSRFCAEKGLKISPNQLANHEKKHSPYIKLMKEKVEAAIEETQLDAVAEVGKIISDAEDVLQEIIDIGHQKIRTEDIEVDGKLLMDAIKEQGNRKKGGLLRDLLENMDKRRFAQRTQPLIEGEIDDPATTT